MATDDTPDSPESIGQELAAIAQQRRALSLPAEEAWGLLRPFSARARIVLAGLLTGWPVRVAALRAGLTPETIRRWGHEEPAFREAVSRAQEWGFGAVYEAELYDRALDRADRGSMRALEMVTKARAPEYRDKAQLEIQVIRQALDAEEGLRSGWREALPPGD